MLKIATRGSDLALAQARRVQGLLAGTGQAAELCIIKTRGDVALDLRLSDNLEKGLFTSEVESAVAEGRADLAVHSLKDMPTAGDPRCSPSIVIERVASEDLLLVAPHAVADTGILPVREGARIGTSAARRVAMLNAWRGDLQPVPIRGNVPTRLRKALEGEVDGVILARAGLHRLQADLSGLRSFVLHPQCWLPAPGQGAIAVQTRSDDGELQRTLRGLSDPQANLAVGLEREALALSEGGCHVPFGARAAPTASGQWCLRLGQSAGPGDWRMTAVTGAPETLAALAYGRLAGAKAIEPASLWAPLEEGL